MKKVSSRKHDRFGRVLDSDPVYLIAALALMALLVSFYAVLLVNMNAIDTKTEDLKEHPYAVTVAAGRGQKLLMHVTRHASANAGQPLSVRAHAGDRRKR